MIAWLDCLLVAIGDCTAVQLDALKAENARLRAGGSETVSTEQPNPIATAIADVTNRIAGVKIAHSIIEEVRLVAVSKKKPAQAIIDALQFTGRSATLASLVQLSLCCSFRDTATLR